MIIENLLQQFRHAEHYQRLILLYHFHQKILKKKTTISLVKLPKTPGLYISNLYYFFLEYHDFLIVTYLS